MSKAVSALNGASFSGMADVIETGLTGMITLRGALSDATFQQAVVDATGCAVPAQRKVIQVGGNVVVWMSPDELLIVTDHAKAPAMVDTLSAALKGQHALAVNVSDARACFTLKGVGARETLAKVAPVDFDGAAFSTGDVRRSRLAQVAGAVWLNADGSFTIVCFRSVGQYVFDLLKTAAHPLSAVNALG